MEETKLKLTNNHMILVAEGRAWNFVSMKILWTWKWKNEKVQRLKSQTSLLEVGFWKE